MLNVGTFKTVSYLTSFGLLGGIGYIGYDYYENGQHQSFFDAERAAEVLYGVEAPKPPVPNGLNYNTDITPAILDFVWTGELPKEVVVDTGPVDTGPVEPIVIPVDELLDVVYTQFSTADPAKSSGLVRLTPEGGDPEDLWMYIGDSLPAPNDNVSVLDIDGESMTFSFSDEEREPESVKPHDRAGNSLIAKAGKDGQLSRKTRPIVGSKSAAAPDVPTRTVRKNSQYYVGTEDAARFATEYEQIISRDIGSETHFDKDGNRAGIKITRVEPDSIAAQHGMQEGDIIKSVNGVAVNSKAEAISFAKKNADKYDIWRVEVENLGRTRIEVYHSPDE